MSFLKLNVKKESDDIGDDELLTLLRETENIIYFDRLYERYIPLIYGLCLKYLQSTDKAQDAVIDIFENLVSKIATYEINSFKNWIYSVVKNHCFQIVREQKRESIVNFDSQLMESDSVFTLFDEEPENKAKEILLKDCINRLPDSQQKAIRMFFYEEMSYAEIADVTGFDLKSVKSFLQNGKRNLKNCIEKKSL